MRKILASILSSSIPLMLLSAAPIATAAEATWTCKAEGLVSARYDGSDWAFVHLQAYRSGGNYRVKLNEQRTEATGKTADGTPFVCVKSS